MCGTISVRDTIKANSELVSAPLGIEVGTKYNINTKLKLEDLKPRVPAQILWARG